MKTLKRGFTLIELLVVIAIIGILVTIAVASFTSAQQKGRDAKRKGDLDAIKIALHMFYSDHNTFPPGDPGQNIGWATFIQGGCSSYLYDALINNGYMKKVPDDPKSPDYHYFYYKVTDNEYILASHLENANDPQYITQNLYHCGYPDPNVAHYIVRSP